ncbi:nck-associated protein 5 [Holotrichia oblita]|uniref:Nck-associated protein 5 n=1 Tax=Holotrichia oblita TaxID=644536 RepID=A0ACB9T2Q7_HOLOL|nr:nck-associated protein 5 [Holotrichia oblita]
MEESVRSMLVYKKQADQLRQEKAALTCAFENRCQQYQNTITRLNQEIFSLRQQLEQVSSNSQEGLLQAQTAALHRHAEESRKQYERCLDDVANQVVKALLAQKGLEEVGNLNNKIQELESQNRALTSMLMHQLRSDTTTSLSETENSPSSNHQLALEESGKENKRQPFEENSTSADASPSNLMRTSLAFKHCNSFNSEVLDSTTSNDSSNDSTNEKVVSRIEKHLSTGSEILDTRFSLEDKKRHQVLTKLWTELKGTEVTPKRLIEALSSVDSALWVPPQRPVSLNLQLPILQAAKYRRSRPILGRNDFPQSASKSEEETTGNESPESGNRDEGYSTMSSDVQAEVTRSSAEVVAPTRGLEDLKEATDETEIAETRLLVTDNKDPDIFYIPFNLLNLKPRNSFPPGKDILPFQHIMRSFSDSHLCIKITTAPSPYYTFTSPISSSPSVLLLDITEKTVNPLRRTKATPSLLGNKHLIKESFRNNLILILFRSTSHKSFLLANAGLDIRDGNTSPHSWTSIAEDRLECTAFDAEYIQHWLRLDETRTTLQQHRDLFELEYDRTELEDWSLNLSSDDVREHWKRNDATTPGQISLSTLPSIQENNALELEEDSNECLWNNPSFLMDKDGHEIVTLLMDNGSSEKQWPYAINGDLNLHNSPDNSWSSGASDCCHSHEPETCSKRSSAALSGCSDDTGELPLIGTDFTRDFYRLVKFESTKSLASTSSRSLGGALSENGDRDAALQNVLTFIAEQQKYVHGSRDTSSNTNQTSRPCSVNEVTKEFNIEAPPQEIDELKICECSNVNSTNETTSTYNITNKSNNEHLFSKNSENENYVTLKQLCTEFNLNEQNAMMKDTDFKKAENLKEDVLQTVAYADEICLVTPIDIESENCSNITEQPVDICSSVSVELTSTDYQQTVLDTTSDRIDNSNKKCMELSDISSTTSDLIKSSDTVSSDSPNNGMSESLTSSNSTPDTIVSKIPRRKYMPSKIPVSPAKTNSQSSSATATNNNNTSTNNNNDNENTSKLPKSKIPHKNSKISRPKTTGQKQKVVHVQSPQPQHVITAEKTPPVTSGVISNIIDGPPHRAVSFHERATSKDVIDELNRMIKNGEDNVQDNTENDAQVKLDEACRPTGWVHVEQEIDLTDPKVNLHLNNKLLYSISELILMKYCDEFLFARANLLDVMMASVSSDSSPTSSCGGSVTSDSTEDPPDYGQLHRIHRFHRQKKGKYLSAYPHIVILTSITP